MFQKISTLILFGFLANMLTAGSPQPIQLAVATNFKTTLETIVTAYRQSHDLPITVSAGATGQLFAQISNGAPFDIFFAADEQACAKLVAAKLMRLEDVRVYSRGKIVIFTPSKMTERDIEANVMASKLKHLGIANPKLAPYGKAAVEALKTMNAYTVNEKKIVWAENVGQSLQFAVSGGADFSFVSLAQVLQDKISGSHWVVPDQHYQPIIQSAGVLVKSRDRRDVIEFWDFLKSDAVKKIIMAAGYNN